MYYLAQADLALLEKPSLISRSNSTIIPVVIKTGTKEHLQSRYKRLELLFDFQYRLVTPTRSKHHFQSRFKKRQPVSDPYIFFIKIYLQWEKRSAYTEIEACARIRSRRHARVVSISSSPHQPYLFLSFPFPLPLPPAPTSLAGGGGRAASTEGSAAGYGRLKAAAGAQWPVVPLPDLGCYFFLEFVIGI